MENTFTKRALSADVESGSPMSEQFGLPKKVTIVPNIERMERGRGNRGLQDSMGFLVG